MGLKYYMLIVMFCMAAIGAKCQEDVITKITFTSATRGYQKEIFISPDSLIKTINNRGKIQVVKRKLEPGTWEQVVASLGDLKLEEISQLPSPTAGRSFDAAHHSSLIIQSKKGGTWSHAFDDESPNAKLLALMDTIKKIDDEDLAK
jgi:hypothetical protein